MGQPWGPHFDLTYNLAFAHRNSQIAQGAVWSSVGPLLTEAEGIAQANGFSAEHSKIQAMINKYQGHNVPAAELENLLKGCLGQILHRHAGAWLGWARGSCVIGIVAPDPAVPGDLRDQLQHAHDFLKQAGSSAVAKQLKDGAIKEADKGTLNYRAVIGQIERFMASI